MTQQTELLTEGTLSSETAVFDLARFHPSGCFTSGYLGIAPALWAGWLPSLLSGYLRLPLVGSTHRRLFDAGGCVRTGQSRARIAIF